MEKVGDRIRTARDNMSRHVMSSIFWGTDGELRILLSTSDPDMPHNVGATLGSAKLGDVDTIKALIRGWELGYASRMGDEM